MERKFLILVVSFLIGLMSFQAYGLEVITRSSPENGLSAHEPIEINSDNDLNETNGVVYGSGTSDDPYIIQGWDIDADSTDYGIYIGNTTDHLIIRDCRIHHANDGKGDTNLETRWSNGITLHNVENCVIERCEFQNNRWADIQLYHSNWNLIRFNRCNSDIAEGQIIIQDSSNNNTVVGNELDPHRQQGGNNETFSTHYGVRILYDSDDNRIIGNRIFNHSGSAIEVMESSENMTLIQGNLIRNNYGGISVSGGIYRVTDNRILNNDYHGIDAGMTRDSLFFRNLCDGNRRGIYLNYDGGWHPQGNNMVYGNMVRYNEEEGIMVHGKDDIFHHNTVLGNSGDGFSIWDHRNMIYSNQIEQNGGYGVFLEAYRENPDNAQHNQIYWNNIINNSGSPQALDECNNNSWNKAQEGNYWSDHASPDSDSNGIVDDPYLVNISKNISDRKPVTTPFNITTEEPEMPAIIVVCDFEYVKVNETFDRTYEAIDLGEAPEKLTWNITTNATWLTVTDNNVVGTPNHNQVGRYWVNIIVNEGPEPELYSRNITLRVIQGSADGGKNNSNNQTVPGGDPGNDTEPDNNTGNESDSIWSEETNNPPRNLDMEVPEDIKEGEKIVLKASSFDPDSELGDNVTYQWYVDGKNVGSGDTMEIYLDEGTHEIKLVATDSYGKSVDISRHITVEGKNGGKAEIQPIIWILAIVVLLSIIVGSIFIMKKNRRKPPVEETTTDEIPGFPTEPTYSKEQLFTPGTIPKVTAGKLLEYRNDGVMAEPPLIEVEDLSPSEETILKGLESDAFSSKRVPLELRRRELKELLRQRSDEMDEETYLTVMSILDEE